MGRTINIHIDYNKACYLAGAVTDLIKVYEPETEAETLYLEYILILHQELKEKLVREANRYKLTFDGLTALCFINAFGDPSITWDTYTNVIVLDIIEKLHKEAGILNKKAKRI